MRGKGTKLGEGERKGTKLGEGERDLEGERANPEKIPKISGILRSGLLRFPH